MKNKMSLSIKLILVIFALVIIGILTPKHVDAEGELLSLNEISSEENGSGTGNIEFNKSLMSKLTVDPKGGIWKGSTQKQIFIKNFNETMNIPKPIAPTGNIVAFNYNGGIQGVLKTSVALTFKGWIYTYGENEATLTANYEGNTVILPTTSREGLIFEGWYTDRLAGTRVGGAGDIYTPKGTELLYAHWKVDASEIDATLVLNGTEEKTSFELLAMGNANGETTISSYRFYINGSLYKTVTTSEKQVVCEVTDRTEGTSYNCYVVVTNSEGQTKQSNTVKVKTALTITQSGEDKILAELCEIGDYVKYGDETDWRVLSKTSTGVTIIKCNLDKKIRPSYNGYGYSYDGNQPKMDEFSESYLGRYRRTDFIYNYDNKKNTTTVNYYNSSYADYYRLAPTKTEITDAQQVISCGTGSEYGYWLATYEYTSNMFMNTYYGGIVKQDAFSKGDEDDEYYIRPVVKLKDNLTTLGKNINGIWELIPNDETDANALTVTFAFTGGQTNSSGYGVAYAVATVSGGNGPYTYQISGVPDNQTETDPIKTNDKAYTYIIGGSSSTYQARVTVTDSWGRVAVSNVIIIQ